MEQAIEYNSENLIFQDVLPDLQAAYLEAGRAELVNDLPIMGGVPLSISAPQYAVGPEEYGRQQPLAPYGDRVGYSDHHMVPTPTPSYPQYHQQPTYTPTTHLWTPPTNHDRNFLSRPHEPGMNWPISSSPIHYAPTLNARNPPDQILHPSATILAPQHFVPPDLGHSPILKGLYKSAKFLWENAKIDRDLCMQWLAGGRLWEQAVSIEAQAWKQSNYPEPTSAGLATSLFDVFFNERNPHRCLWVTQEGICGHWISKRCLAQGHARKHFEYNPFPCGGKCGHPTCDKKYACKDRLSDHISRKMKPRKKCDYCKVDFSTQNVRRHEKMCKGNPGRARPSSIV